MCTLMPCVLHMCIHTSKGLTCSLSHKWKSLIIPPGKVLIVLLLGLTSQEFLPLYYGQYSNFWEIKHLVTQLDAF